MRLKQCINQILPNEVFKWKGANFVYRAGWIYVVYSSGIECEICRAPEIKTKGRLQKALRESSYKVK